MAPTPKRSPTSAAPSLPRGPHSLSREQVLNDQRVRLLTAMVDAIGEDGYRTTTIANVIRRAGVSRKTFYVHFANKQECFLAAYDAITAVGMSRVTRAYRDAEGWPGRVEAAIRVFFESAIESPAAVRLGLIEIGAAGAAGIERREQAMTQFEHFIRDGLELAPGSGTVPDTVPRAVVGGLNKVLYTHVLNGQHAKLLKLIPDLVSWATAYYPAPAALLASHQAGSPGQAQTAAGLIGGRAPGTLFPQTLSNGRRRLLPGAGHVSRSFVVHSQRERILDAVANLSAAVGYATLTIEEIVGEAAVSLEAFYEHFKSKEDAFLVAYELGHIKGLGIVERAFGAEADWRSGVREAISALLGYLASEPSFAQLALLDALIATPVSAERSQQGVTLYAQMLLPGFEQAPKNRIPPPITIEAIAGGVSELCFHYAVQGRIRELPEIAIDTTYISLAPFIGAKQAARVATEGA
ncbi:MAG TPA: TetR/AcrR family transcriptional regulator [Solirubrobacteraceae bacterium]